MQQESMKAIADAIWGYILEKYLKPYLADSVCYYVATVTTAPSSGVIGVTRAFDNEVTLPCANNASGLSVGDPCTVLVFGDFSNQIVIGNVSNINNIADNSITTVKVADGAVTEEKLDSGLILAYKNDYVTPQMFGAVGDGYTDDTAAFTALAEYIDENPGANVRIPEGHYIIKQAITISANCTFQGHGAATILDFSEITEPAECCLHFTGSAPSLITALDVDSDTGAYTISVANASGLAGNDLICIQNPTDYSWSSERAYYRQGEFAEIDTVSGNDVTFISGLHDSYAAGVSVYLMHPITVVVRDLAVIAKDNGEVSYNKGIGIRYGRNCTVEGVTASGSNWAQISVRQSYQISVVNCYCDYICEENTGTCYAIAIANSQNILVDGCFLRSRRHTITNGGGASGITPVTRFSKTINCVMESLSNYSWDCHTNAEYCSAFNSTMLSGFDSTGSNIMVDGCYIQALCNAAEDTQGTNRFFEGSYMVRGYLRVVNCEIVVDNPTLATNGNCRLKLLADYVEDPDIVIEFVNNKIHTTNANSRLIWIESDVANNNITVRLVGNTIWAPRLDANATYGGGLYVFGIANVIVKDNITHGFSVAVLDRVSSVDYPQCKYLQICGNVFEYPKNFMVYTTCPASGIERVDVSYNVVRYALANPVVIDKAGMARICNNRFEHNNRIGGTTGWHVRVSAASVCHVSENYFDSSTRYSFVCPDATGSVYSHDNICGSPASVVGEIILGTAANVLRNDSVADIKYTLANDKPTTGTWELGSIVYNSRPDQNRVVGWICTASGTPGSWSAFGSF